MVVVHQVARALVELDLDLRDRLLFNVEQARDGWIRVGLVLRVLGLGQVRVRLLVGRQVVSERAHVDVARRRLGHLKPAVVARPGPRTRARKFRRRGETGSLLSVVQQAVGRAVHFVVVRLEHALHRHLERLEHVVLDIAELVLDMGSALS